MKKIILFVFLLIISIQFNIYAEGAKGNSVKSVDTGSLPFKYELNQNYPNPFNPETTIKFVIEKEENVTLKLYSVIGQEVATVISEVLSEGQHSVTINGRDLTSGVYFYTLIAGSFTQTKRMVLIK